MSSFRSFLAETPSEKELIDHAYVGSEWYKLGVQLRLDTKFLNSIRHRSYDDDYMKSIDMFQEWLKLNPNATRQELFDALKKIGEKAVASKYESFLKDEYENSSGGLFSILTDKTAEYRRVRSLFEERWVKYLPVPDVIAIMKVNNKDVKDKFESYKDLPSKSQFPVEQHFHGATLTCNLLDDMTPCFSGSCGVCGIAKRGFDSSLIGTNIGFQRFGRGFYLAPNSSKCHDYTHSGAGHRAIFLCDVAPGEKYQMEDDQEDLTEPPHGYDSVQGVASPDGSLNYDEIVLYNPDAICPLYLIIYVKGNYSGPEEYF